MNTPWQVPRVPGVDPFPASMLFIVDMEPSHALWRGLLLCGVCFDGDKGARLQFASLNLPGALKSGLEAVRVEKT